MQGQHNGLGGVCPDSGPVYSTFTPPLLHNRQSSVPPEAVLTLTKRVGGFDAEGIRARLERYYLQGYVRRLLGPDHRICICRRMPLPDADFVAVKQHSGSGRWFLGNLAVCGSVWDCPVCMPLIMERRRVEVSAAVEAARARGWYCYLVTFTCSHTRSDDLAHLLLRFGLAGRFMRQHWAWRHTVKDMGLQGTITALEVQYSNAYGWHPHKHSLYFFDKPVEPELLRSTLYGLHSASLSHPAVKLSASPAFGVHVASTFGAVQDYITKYGREPEDDKRPWGVEDELTKHHSKNGRRSPSPLKPGTHRGPLGLLRDYAAGHSPSGSLYADYSRCFKGQRRLHWSQNLRATLGLSPELSDEVLASQRLERAEAIFGRVELDQWRVVLANDCVGELVEAANAGGIDGLASFVAELCGIPVT